MSDAHNEVEKVRNTTPPDAFLAALVDSSDDAIISTSFNGIITTWNKGAERTFGYRTAEIIGKPVSTIIPPELLEEEESILARLSRGERIEHYETVRVRKDGVRRNMSLRVSLIKDKTGEIIGTAKIARDITNGKTERKKIELDLAKSAAQFRLVVEAAPNGLVLVDRRGCILMVNPQMEQMFGFERIEMIGQPVEMLLPDRYRAAHPGQRHDFFSLPSKRLMGHGRDLFARRKDGAEFPVEVGLSPAETPDGTVVLASIIDITMRKQIEQTLAEQARLLDLSKDAIIVRDLNQRILYWNRGAELLFGWSKDEAQGQNVFALLRSRFPEPLDAILEQFRLQGSWQGEITQTTRDGKTLIVFARWNLERDKHGQPLRILQTQTDITESIQAREDLACANRKLSQHAADLERIVTERTAHLQASIAELESVSYSLSHDMRAPLRTIQSFSQIVLAEAGDKLGPTETDLLTRTISAASRLDRLIQDVLTYNHLGRESIELTTINVERLLRQIIHERPDFQSPKAEIEIQLPLASVRGHEAHLTQCLTNLLDNAVKFAAPQRQPRIRVWKEFRDGKMRLWFEDNGIGIPKEAQERVFGMFQRVHGETTYPGTGIGLSIVRKAVERMGGSVGVESEPGKGSRFWLELQPAESSA